MFNLENYLVQTFVSRTVREGSPSLNLQGTSGCQKATMIWKQLRFVGNNKVKIIINFNKLVRFFLNVVDNFLSCFLSFVSK